MPMVISGAVRAAAQDQVARRDRDDGGDRARQRASRPRQRRAHQRLHGGGNSRHSAAGRALLRDSGGDRGPSRRARRAARARRGVSARPSRRALAGRRPDRALTARHVEVAAFPVNNRPETGKANQRAFPTAAGWFSRHVSPLGQQVAARASFETRARATDVAGPPQEKERASRTGPVIVHDVNSPSHSRGASPRLGFAPLTLYASFNT